MDHYTDEMDVADFYDKIMARVDQFGFFGLSEQLERLTKNRPWGDLFLRIPHEHFEEAKDLLPDVENQGPYRFWTLFVRHYGAGPTRQFSWNLRGFRLEKSDLVPSVLEWQEYAHQKPSEGVPSISAIEIELIHFEGTSIEHARRKLVKQGAVLAGSEILTALALQEDWLGSQRWGDSEANPCPIVVAGIDVNTFPVYTGCSRSIVLAVRPRYSGATTSWGWNHLPVKGRFLIPVIRDEKHIIDLP